MTSPPPPPSPPRPSPPPPCPDIGTHAEPGRTPAPASEARVTALLADTSVVIPVKDDPLVVQCVASVDEDVEIVLALNGADEATHRRIRALDRPVRVAEIDEPNLGAAYNAAIDAAGRRHVLLMDSDCVFLPGTIRALAEAVADHPVVKGRVRFRSARGRLSRWIEQSRSFQIADHVNAYSPPLIYDRDIVDRIGGYHYSGLIHWEEDREFDFRLQLAGIPVAYLPDAVVEHAPQSGLTDLRSGLRYGIGEGIGQELGLFPTPRMRWRLANDLGSIVSIGRRKGPGPAFYRTAWLTSYHLGTLYQHLRDPYGVRPHYPRTARRVRAHPGVPGHSTLLSGEQRALLRASHERQGRRITSGPQGRVPS
ncbi:glycosyltransferase family 2 protein [Streptomyces daliensis]